MTSTAESRPMREKVSGEDHRALVELQPLALSPVAAAQFLSISKRSLSRLVAAGKIVARKDGSRTLVDVASLKAYYASLPVKAVAPRK
jgi:excisionase family DNA binding protein